MPIKEQTLIIHIDFQVLRVFYLVVDSTQDAISYIFICKVFPMMVMALQHERDLVLTEKIDKGEALFKRHISRADLRIVGIEEISVGKYDTVPVILSVSREE